VRRERGDRHAGQCGGRGCWGLEGFVEVVREQLAAGPTAHFDETGARVGGRLAWVHSASTGLLSLFTVHAKRGKVAMDAAGVLPCFRGVAVHDGWSPYWRYQHITHALCGAHLLRELEGLVDEPGQGWAPGMAELLVDVKLAGDRARRSPAGRLLARLDVHRDEVLRSLDDTCVPFDNNQAERDLRMVKLQQKVSGCWRTLTGAAAFLAVRSYVATARKHRMNPLVVLRRLFEGAPWLPATTGP
jgi:transposase